MTVSIASLTATDLAAIEELHRQFPIALVQRDFDALAGLYTGDADFMPPHHPLVHGRAAIKTWMASFPVVSRFDLQVDQIEGRADLAYVRGTFAMTLQPEGAAGPISDSGKYVEILKLQSDGSWLVAIDIFNSDNP
jgi:ketosteroid isomerase-like protein